MNIFDYLYEDFRFEKDKPIRLFESFAGIGFQRMGLELAKIPYEVVGISEIDKFAIESYGSIHGECPNLGSITDIKGGEMPKDIDLFTYSFPCTDLSKAGKQKGLDNTRSGLVYEVLRILHELKEINNLPKVLIMENVVDLVQTKFIKEFNEIQSELEEIGYTNYTQTLNAKNYGIAQNRDRVFMVSILGDYNYNFPKGFELEHRLKDYLEEEVDEKYYLSDKMVNFVKERKILMPEATKKGYAEAKEGDGVYLDRPHQKRGVVQDGMIQTLKTSGNDVGVVVAGEMRTDEGIRTFSDNIMGTLRTTNSGGDNVVIENRFYQQAIETLEENDVEFGDSINAYNKSVDRSGQSPTITTRPEGFKTAILPVTNNLRIRKLTPRETGRLMGMNDQQIDKQLSTVSNSQAYKQHGNGIVAQVIGLIIGMMVYEDEKELRDTVIKNSHKWLKEKI